MIICAFMRVTIFHKERGGMELHGKILLDGLVRAGHKVVVITTSHPEGLTYKKVDGVEYYFLKDVITKKYTRRWWTLSIKKFEELQKVYNFDLIWSQSTAAYSYLLKNLKDKYNIPCVVILHGTTSIGIKYKMNDITSVYKFIRFLLSLLKTLYLRFTWETKLHKMDAFIAVSKEVRAQAIREYGIREDKIYYVPNGIDVELFKPDSNKKSIMRKKFGLSDKEFILLVSGRIKKHKGMHIAVKALSYLIKRGLKVKLFIVGKGSYLKRLKELIDRLRLSEYVIICGSISYISMPDYYNICDIYLMPSLGGEGLPLSIIEAMSTQKPVIATRIGGIPTAIDDGINGILIPPGDVKILAEKIYSLLNNGETMNRLAKNAREKAIKEFSREKMIRDTIEIFERYRKQ